METVIPQTGSTAFSFDGTGAKTGRCRISLDGNAADGTHQIADDSLTGAQPSRLPGQLVPGDCKRGRLRSSRDR